MLSRRITFADLAAVASTDRHRLRNLLKAVPEFNQRPTNERVATEYTRHDLAVVAVLCELDRMGLRKEVIATWAPQIQQVLLGPRPIATNPQLFLHGSRQEAHFVDGHGRAGAGILVGLRPVFNAVDAHCIGPDFAREPQRELEFGPTGLTATRPAAPARRTGGGVNE